MGQLAVIEQQFKPLVPRMEAAIPAGANLPVKQVMQSILIACERNEKLMDCSPISLHQCAFSACALGLLVDGVTGQGYMVPYKGQAQFQIGFKGYSTIAARSGFILGGGVIYPGDKPEIMLGSGGYARVPFQPENRRPGVKIVAAYATLESNHFPTLVDAMSLDEIEHVRKLSKATYSDSPWNVHFAQMAIKTIKKRLAKSAPLDIMQLASAFEDATDQGHTAYIRPDDRALIVDAEAQDVTHFQPPPAEPFTLDQPAKQSPFRLIATDGRGFDLLNAGAWLAQIDKIMAGIETTKSVEDFQDRHRAIIREVEIANPDVAVEARTRVMNRLSALRGAA